jgi:hypothetical protein
VGSCGEQLCRRADDGGAGGQLVGEEAADADVRPWLAGCRAGSLVEVELERPSANGGGCGRRRRGRWAGRARGGLGAVGERERERAPADQLPSERHGPPLFVVVDGGVVFVAGGSERVNEKTVAPANRSRLCCLLPHDHLAPVALPSAPLLPLSPAVCPRYRDLCRRHRRRHPQPRPHHPCKRSREAARCVCLCLKTPRSSCLLHVSQATKPMAAYTRCTPPLPTSEIWFVKICCLP